MSASIVGLGTWLPPERRLNDAWPADFGARARHEGERTFNDIPPPGDPRAAALVERARSTWRVRRTTRSSARTRATWPQPM